MTRHRAEQIATWTYPDEYSVYSFKNNEAEIEEIQNGLHMAVCENRTLVGFVAFGWSAQVRTKETNEIYDDESFTDIAFGLKPSLCGQGKGRELVLTGIDFVKSLFPEDGVRLTVRADNKRAIKCYKSAGFKRKNTFTNKKDGFDYVIMTLT